MKKQILCTALILSIALTSCSTIKSTFTDILFKLRVDQMHPSLRSDIVTSPDIEKTIVDKAKLTYTDDGKIRVLYLSGTPYERGYQHGYLLKKEIHDSMVPIIENAIDKFKLEELFDESYERMRPFISQDYIDEMQGLAHGARLPLRLVHAFHALPEIGEWGGKKNIKETLKRMISGEFGTSCSNLAASGSATEDGELYTVRILDWGLHRISNLHKYPLITVTKPNNGENISANIGWVGFLGAVSGMNDKGITLGEMGYGDSVPETLRGKPMPFMLRDILNQASSLKDVRRIISTSAPTNSFVFLMSDGKTKESEIYLRDQSRFTVTKPGQNLIDGEKVNLPGIANMTYGGHFKEKMTDILQKDQGKITVEKLQKEIIPSIVMESNFQNVIYEPGKLKFWVSNAKDRSSKASYGEYTMFDLGEAAANFKK